MKNIHQINDNIYITNDEEIKEGDYFWKPDCNMIFKAEYTPHKGCEKVILTTDQDLIKDGVQSIDDGFLEWFVKNPSCESVEVGYGWIRLTETDNEGYWISIPDNQFEMQQAEPKQETLEEAAKNAYKKHSVKDDALSLNEQIQRSGGFIVGFKEGMMEGAKWQSERIGLMEIELNHTKTLLASCEKALENRDNQAKRMYSEEEVIELLNKREDCINQTSSIFDYTSTKEWFEQFKKK
jgi:hypothetical protein